MTERCDEVHAWFGLSYANYFVMPRVILDAMPCEWQRAWVALMEELDNTFDLHGHGLEYEVHRRGERGRFVHDPLSAYRHPDRAMIDGLRRKEAT